MSYFEKKVADVDVEKPKLPRAPLAMKVSEAFLLCLVATFHVVVESDFEASFTAGKSNCICSDKFSYRESLSSESKNLSGPMYPLCRRRDSSIC